jgi:predicted HTH transcriptional regulator
MKHYQVRFYPNGQFKVVETNDFHPSNKKSVFSSYNQTNNESYDFIVADEKSIDKAKKKIATSLIKEVKKKRDEYQKKLDSLEKVLNNL